MRKLLLLAPGLLLASCHSEQVALRTRSAISKPIAATTPVVVLDSTLAATVVAAHPATVPNVTARATEPLPTQRPKPHRASSLRPIVTVAATTTRLAPVAKRWAHRLQRKRPTEGAAESGLGSIGLFFIGVVLALLAGLGALVSLIPGVSFWGGIGLAAAGLVVLFLLYSLLSGGKGKKK